MIKVNEVIIFEDTAEMYDYISEGNDIYSPTAEMYIFSYNDGGSIAYYTIDEKRAKELAQFSEENNEYWAAALGPSGHIIDAEDDTTNIVMFLADFIHNDWYNTKDYGKMVLSEALKLYYVECGMNEKRIVRAKNFEDALVLALLDGFNKETIVDFYDAIDEVHLYEEEPVSEGAATYRMVNELTLYGNNEGFRNPRRLEDVILNYDNEDIFINEEDMETFKTLRENLKKYFKKNSEAKSKESIKHYEVNFYSLNKKHLFSYEISAKNVKDALSEILTSYGATEEADNIFSVDVELEGKMVFSLPTKEDIREFLNDKIFANAYYGGDAFEVTLKNQGVILLKSVFIADCRRDALIKALEKYSEVGQLLNISSAYVLNVQLGGFKEYKNRKEIAEEIKDGCLSEEIVEAFPLAKKTFEVAITETIEKTVTVEAESAEEAEEMAEKMVFDGDIILGDGMDGVDFTYKAKEV